MRAGVELDVQMPLPRPHGDARVEAVERGIDFRLSGLSIQAAGTLNYRNLLHRKTSENPN